jgi:hypothetical protein
MSRELLMYEGQLSLCRCDAERVERLAVCPVPLPDLWCWSDDRAHVLVVDRQRKRVTTFRLAGDHFERTMSPLALPRGVVAHCVAMKGPQPYIGASSVWVPNAESGWTQTKMPEFALGEGKQLDGLILDGDRLVAVDDLMLPKWNLEYDISTPDQPRYIRCESIRANTTYERIYAASGGARWFATLSHGLNHGHFSSYCTVFVLGTLECAWAWSFYTNEPSVLFPLSWEKGQSFREALALKRAVFLGDVLCVLSESSGAEPCAVLNWIDLTAAPLPLPAFKERRAHRPTLREEEISELAEASELVAASGGDGVYVCGRSRGGAHTVAWRPIGSLED